MKNADLFIFVGEQSADDYGYLLLKALEQTAPTLSIYGVGGPKMRTLGFDCLLPMEHFQIMSFSDFVISGLKRRKCFETIIESILERAPRIVLLIDYPSGIFFVEKLRKRGYKGQIIQYVCPPIRLRKKDRKAMSKSLNALFTIFPFEQALFQKFPLPVHFVGHPVLEKLKTIQYSARFREEFSINPNAPLVGIFSGSRSKVLKANFPAQLSAALELQKEDPSLWIGVSVANDTAKAILEPLVKGMSQIVLIPETHTYDLMQACTIAIATCGTVALEIALHEKPTVVTYHMHIFDVMVAFYYSGWSFPYYCIVNVLGNQLVFPELVYKNCTREKIYKELKALYFSSEEKLQCSNRCKELKNALLASENYPSEQMANHLVSRL